MVTEQVAGAFVRPGTGAVVVPGNEHHAPGEGAFEGAAPVPGDDVLHVAKVDRRGGAAAPVRAVSAYSS